MPGRAPMLLILTAMRAEAAPIIERLRLRDEGELAAPMPFQIFASESVVLVTPGRDARTGVDNIGTQAAAVMTDAALRATTPRLALNAGVAGGFASQGAFVGELLLATEAVFHDRRIDLPGFREYGVGGFPCADISAPGFDMRPGAVSSGDSLDALDAELRFMHERDVVAKDMEAASMAWIASLHDTPFASVKCETDFVDRPHATTTDFETNLATACSRLGEFVERLVHTVWQD